MIAQIVYEVIVVGTTTKESFALYNDKTRANETADALRRGGKTIEVRERRIV